jgi:uncharacterized protein
VTDLLASVHDVEPEVWNAWTRPAGPAARFGWFSGLEATLDRSGPDRWTPAHLRTDDLLVPLYEREGWRGEFVWDDPIEAACDRSGLPYGPRAVGVLPWTPIRGPRILTDPTRDRAELLTRAGPALVAAAADRGWTGVHLQFCADDEVDALVAQGWIERLTWQYVWQGEPGEGFLAQLPGKRRREIRREMRAFAQQGFTLQVVSGDDASDDVWQSMPQLYADTARRHGDEVPLGPEFFAEVRARMAEDVVFFIARRGEELVAATFQVRTADALFGRIWGTREAHPYLHFNLAYHFPLQWAWEQGMTQFEPGHGGEYKRRRGCAPVLCRSAHHFAHAGLHRAVADWASREAGWVSQHLSELSPVPPGP